MFVHAVDLAVLSVFLHIFEFQREVLIAVESVDHASLALHSGRVFLKH